MREKTLKVIRNFKEDGDQIEIIKKGFSFLIFRFGGIIAGYLFTFIIAKYYGASVNGLVALSFTIFLIISVIGRLGIDANLVKYYSVETNLLNNSALFYNVLLKALVFSIIISFLIFNLKEFIAGTIFNKPQLVPYLFWAILAIPPWVVVILCSGLLRAKRLNNWFAFLNNPGRFIFSLIFLILFSISTLNGINAIKAHFFGILTLSLLALAISIYKLKSVSFKSNKNSWAFLKDSFPMMVSTTLIILLGWMDTLVLGIYETDDAIGIYNVALKISAIIALILEAVSSILAPKLAAYYQEGDKNKFANLVQFSTRLIFITSCSIAIILFLFHNKILGFFGKEFEQGSTTFIILSIGPLICAFSGSIGIILQMIGKQKIHQNFVFIAFLVNLILNFTLTPLYGVIGAATSTVISLLVWNVLGAWYLKKKLDIKSYFSLSR